MTTRREELNLDALDDIFRDGDQIDADFEQKNVDFKTDIEYDDPLEALKLNIFNANQLLEKIQHEMNNGNFSARLAEVAGTIINSVTQSSKEILADKNYGEYMEVRRAMAQLKAREIELKEQRGLNNVGGNTTNVLITSREDLLKMLENKRPKPIEIESNTTEDVFEIDNMVET